MKLFATTIAAAAASLTLGAFVAASPAAADTIACDYDSCSVYYSHRHLTREERDARRALYNAENAARAAGWAHYLYNEYVD
jgi:hypothetical protein